MNRLSPGYVLVCLNVLVTFTAVSRADDYESVVKPFLAEHCYSCHGDDDAKADFRLDLLPTDLSIPANATHWNDVMDRLNAGTMPPRGRPRPPAATTAKVVNWIAAKFAETEAARLARRAAVTFHRLTREEYANTIRDLLGVTFIPSDPVGLPEDDDWKGLERIGAVQMLSPSHVEKYYAAAALILAEAFPDQPVVPFEYRQPAYKMRNQPQDWTRVEKDGLADKVRVELWPGASVQHGRAGLKQLTHPGDYFFRIRLSGLQPDHGPAPHLVVYAKEIDRVLYESDILAPEDQPTTVEFVTHLPAGHHTLAVSNQVPGPSLNPRSGREDNRRFFFRTTDRNSRAPWQLKLTDEQDRPLWPLLILDWIEVQGPLGAGSPTLAQREYWPDDCSNRESLHRSLSQFVSRAYRRPERPGEIDRLMQLVQAELATGEPPIAAFRTALQAVLCSTDFLYLVEGKPGQNSATLDEWEFAARLAYFLTSGPPDERMRAVAASNRWQDPAILRSEVRRLLSSGGAEQLSDSFVHQWLQLRNVGKFPPDKLLYPDYDGYLEKCLVTEPKRIFREVLTNNLSIREFLHSDWTMLNGRLARHYGIPGIDGSEFRRVVLPPDAHRGGLLTTAAALSLTSDGQRHRPVHRGKWLMETVYGKSPPPPPPNVDPIEPTPPTGTKVTLRAKLDAHKRHAQCAACHATIDPLGFAFDNYDAIGRWRTVELVGDGQGDNPPVDASGELPDGRRFTTVEEFKHLLTTDLDQFAAALVEKLATYAVRRTMTVDDRADLAAIVTQSKSTDYRLADLIEALVMSPLFRKR